MRLAPGLHSQRTAAAISSGRPSRPIGWSLTMSSMVIDSLAIMSATIGVSMAPGHTALMRIPLEAYSSAALFVSPITPCLDAWYIRTVFAQCQERMLGQDAPQAVLALKQEETTQIRRRRRT